MQHIPGRIVFTGNNVTTKELKYAHKTGVTLNLDSIYALERLSTIVGTEGEEISIKINPMAEEGHHEHCITGNTKRKFGIREDEGLFNKNIIQIFVSFQNFIKKNQ